MLGVHHRRGPGGEGLVTVELPAKLSQKMELLSAYLQQNRDVVSREFRLKGKKKLSAVVIFMQGITDYQSLNRDILLPLMNLEFAGNSSPRDFIEEVTTSILTVGEMKTVTTASAMIQSIFDGLTVLMFDGISEVLAIDIRSGEYRQIQEPLLDHAVRGPRESFTENIITNISLVRRKVRDPNLVVESLVLGQRSRTEVAILYIKDIADPGIVAEIRRRLAQINIDGVLSAGQINQLIEDKTYSIFPAARTAERADMVADNLLEGRIAIASGESPYMLIYPTLFIEFFRSLDDSHERSIVGSFIQPLRFIAFFIAVSLPAIYIALFAFQPEFIAHNLLIGVERSRSEVPFPVVFEALIIELLLQLIIEAGLRLPTPLGQTVGVVTGIVLGQAAITAKLASPSIIIIIAIATLSTYVIPNYSITQSVRILRVLMIIASATFGLFGFILGWLMILGQLADLESIGVPTMAPLAPTRFADLKGALIVPPLKKRKNRPVSVPIQDKKRQE